ncbi:septum site-determining protein MinC [Rhodocyclaceae bacterium SMB388]
MSASQLARPVEFRNASIGTTVAVLRETRPNLVADALHKMLGGMPDFFNGEATILDFGELAQTPDQIDWPGLLSLFRRFRLQPIGVRKLPAELAASARQAGFALLDAAELREPQPGATGSAPASVEVERPAVEPASMAEAACDTLIVDRPVRSGQQVYARGGDLVLMAGMSNGAEVIADGSIHCYGPLRGRALAGAQGNTRARIITTNFGPEIVSIAGVYKTFEQGIAAAIAGKPATVRLVGEQDQHTLGIEPLTLD